MICDIFSSMNLIEFSLIDDKGNLIQMLQNRILTLKDMDVDVFGFKNKTDN